MAMRAEVSAVMLSHSDAPLAGFGGDATPGQPSTMVCVCPLVRVIRRHRQVRR